MSRAWGFVLLLVQATPFSHSYKLNSQTSSPRVALWYQLFTFIFAMLDFTRDVPQSVQLPRETTLCWHIKPLQFDINQSKTYNPFVMGHWPVQDWHSTFVVTPSWPVQDEQYMCDMTPASPRLTFHVWYDTSPSGCPDWQIPQTCPHNALTRSDRKHAYSSVRCVPFSCTILS